MEYLILAILGAIIGSFLNVCIYRIPKKESISYPGSHCMTCQHALNPLDLIPLLSYIGLRGRCRYCKSKLSLQYPLVELTNAIFYLLLYHYFAISILSVALAILFSTLLVIAVIDYHSMRIPNSLIIFGLVVGSIYRTVQAIYLGDMMILGQGILGLMLGGGIIAAMMVFSLLVFKKEGMGMGDLKLLGMIGLFLGSRATLFTIFIAIILGSFYALYVLVKKKEKIFPFGPFLSAGAVIAVLWGDRLWRTYMNYML